jgi:hypothetical protein
MRFAAAIVALAACGGPSRKPAAVDSAAPEASSDEPEVRASCDAPPGRLRGCIVDETGAGLAGVTLVLTAPSLPETLTTITDAHGGWAIDVQGSDFTLAVHYADFVSQLAVQVTAETAGKLQPDIVLAADAW